MVTITEIAEQKIKEMIKEEENSVGLRIYVKGGGCSGYQYGMSFEDKIGDDDTMIEKGEGQSIQSIFAEQGEAAFRQIEKAQLLCPV